MSGCLYENEERYMTALDECLKQTFGIGLDDVDRKIGGRAYRERMSCKDVCAMIGDKYDLEDIHTGFPMERIRQWTR